jgi:Spy/CpxP family protein refolding chaperone
MHSLRKVALGATLLFAVAATAAAQQPQSAEQGRQGAVRHGKGGGRMQRPGRALLRGIELSATQQEQLKALHERYRPQHEALHAKVRDSRQATQRPDSAARAALRSERQALMQRQHTEVRALLTPAQQKQFDANVARLKEHGEGRRGWGRQG